jgi:RimJ/RimL family protein N-acetyltransferase
MMLETERLILRPFEKSDLKAVAAMLADPRARQFLGGAKTYEQATLWLERMMAEFAEHGVGFMPIEMKQTGDLIGYAGLREIPYELAFTPATEIGWALAADHWRQGYASEAADRWLAYAFEDTPREEIVAFAAIANLPSLAVMRRIGMRRDAARDFDHPRVMSSEIGYKRHQVHVMTRDEWFARK